MDPNFFVIGAAKSGTSSLYALLRSHPDVFLPEVKEPHYFAFCAAPQLVGPVYASPAAAAESYRALYRDVAGERAVGDTSTSNLAIPGAAEQIRAAVPAAKIVVVLRDPVERAHSHFLHFLAAGAETTRDFAEAVFHEEERLRELPYTYAYKGFGRYAQLLRPYLELFGRERVLIHLYEDFASDPQAVVKATFSFLGVDPLHPLPAATPRENVSGVPRHWRAYQLVTGRGRGGRIAHRVLPASVRGWMRERIAPRLLHKPRVAPQVRARLISEFRSDIGELETLIGRDLSRWLRV